MPTEDAYSSGHLVLSHFGTCMCSNVETNLSWTCLVSGLLNFEHPSVLLFCFAFFLFSIGVESDLFLFLSIDQYDGFNILNLIEIVILWVYYTIHFGFSLFRHFWGITLNFLSYFVRLRIKDKGAVPEMRIWSILLIKPRLKMVYKSE